MLQYVAVLYDTLYAKLVHLYYLQMMQELSQTHAMKEGCHVVRRSNL